MHTIQKRWNFFIVVARPKGPLSRDKKERQRHDMSMRKAKKRARKLDRLEVGAALGAIEKLSSSNKVYLDGLRQRQ